MVVVTAVLCGVDKRVCFTIQAPSVYAVVGRDRVNIQSFFAIACYLVLLTVMHELGHVVCARLLGKRVSDCGVSLRPVPHFFVTIEGDLRRGAKCVYLLSGVSVVVLLSVVFILLSAECYTVRVAVILQLLLDTNPLYSDVALVFRLLTKRRGVQDPTLATLFTEYHYTGVWYLHLVIWVFCILLTIKTLR